MKDFMVSAPSESMPFRDFWESDYCANVNYPTVLWYTTYHLSQYFQNSADSALRPDSVYTKL
eukprot:scaffold10915_cov85-Cyclotella_meneghiniana.AAC.4